ncbi:hypothetical protein [Maribacter sp. 2210JD10-5]|uniref:hypothetical protein n=1 Tax=Maribacter sp. 2210JD10-5 TaxID=3386272 RepID=UPI0039BC5F70
MAKEGLKKAIKNSGILTFVIAALCAVRRILRKYSKILSTMTGEVGHPLYLLSWFSVRPAVQAVKPWDFALLGIKFADRIAFSVLICRVVKPLRRLWQEGPLSYGFGDPA